ncbi:serine protease [Hyphomicrobium sp. CS1BSMeth3]|uniref:S1 family peptidase n=1 Tax=Hyphomicrobium sp. CS1BSMeth3 TaxID=1892844 RepID=UPI000931B58A|nr:serine protease [Hyphomicrobium sp. CS1BSMeth3]
MPFPQSFFRAVFLVTMILTGPATAEPRDEALRSTAFVRVGGSDPNGPVPNRVGTGFVVGQGAFVITAYHTVAPPPGGWRTNDVGLPDLRIAVVLRNAMTDLPNDVREASIVEIDEQYDVALLQFRGAGRRGLATCPQPEMAIGDDLLIAGLKQEKGALEPRLELRKGSLVESSPRDAPFLRVSANTEEGFSGGPVFKVEQDGLRLVGMLKGGAPLSVRTDSIFAPTRALRQKIIAACDVPCRHPDHGLERYLSSRDQQPPHITDWLRGGVGPVKACDAYAADERRQNHADVITVIRATDHDMRFFTGMRDGNYIVREAQYKYRCQLRYESDPVYKLRVSSSCPAAPNPRGLPR